jgi:hypothetical protein
MESIARAFQEMEYSIQACQSLSEEEYYLYMFLEYVY